MTVEQFFSRLKNTSRGRYDAGSIQVINYRDREGGGWRVDYAGRCAYGDSLSDALIAAYDCALRRESRFARRWPPSPGMPSHCVKYDYRTTDWRMPRVRL